MTTATRTGHAVKLSELGELDSHAFRLFLGLLGEALGEQCGPDETIERVSADGTLRVRLEPLHDAPEAVVMTPDGAFSGRDHLIVVTTVD